MKIYITKYALTKGIIEADGQIEDNCVSVRDLNNSLTTQYFHEGEWYDNKNDAIKKAEEMRLNKIDRLKNQIKKLEKMTFK